MGEILARSLQEAIRVIQNHSQTQPEKSLFLYLPYQAVHVGNTPEPDHPEYALDQAPLSYIQVCAGLPPACSRCRRSMPGITAACLAHVCRCTTLCKTHNGAISLQ